MVIWLGIYIDISKLIGLFNSWLNASAGWISSRLIWIAVGSVAAILIFWKVREPDGLFIRLYFLAFRIAKIGGTFYRYLITGFVPSLIRLVIISVIVTLFVIVLEISIGGFLGSEGLNEITAEASSNNTTGQGLLQANTFIPNVNLSFYKGAILVLIPNETSIASNSFGNILYEIPLPLRVSVLFLENLFSQWAIILILWLFWEFYIIMRLRRNKIVIENFKDHRSDKDNAVVKGLSELLAAHLSDISKLYSEINEMTSIQTTSGAVEPLSTTTLNAGDLGDVVKNPLTIESKINFGLFEIPIGFLLSLLNRIFQGPKIIGCMQCILNADEKEEIVISAQMLGGTQYYSWRVSRELPDLYLSNKIISISKDNDKKDLPKQIAKSESKLSQKNENINREINSSLLDRLYDDMVREIAYRIFTDIQFNISGRDLIRWKATRKFSEGLRAYRDHLRVPRDRRIKLFESESRFIEALIEDDKLHLAYYNLGVVYTMLKRPESAEKAFMMFIERNTNPSSNEAGYYARAMSLFEINKREEETLKEILENLGYIMSLEDMEYFNYKHIIKFCLNNTKAIELLKTLQWNEKELSNEDEASLLRNALHEDKFCEIINLYKATCDETDNIYHLKGIESIWAEVLNSFIDSWLLSVPAPSGISRDDFNGFNIRINKKCLQTIKIYMQTRGEAIILTDRISDRYEEVIKICNHLIELKPNYDLLAKVYNLKGSSQKFKNIDEADESYKMAASNSLRAMIEAKWSGLKLDDTEEITAACLSDLASVRIGSDSVYIGPYLARIKKRDASVNLLLSKAKTISKNKFNTYMALARFYEAQLDFDKSINELERALILSPTSIDCILYLAWINAKEFEIYMIDSISHPSYSGTKEAALNLCERALDLFPYPCYETNFNKEDEIARINKNLRRLEDIYKRLDEKEKGQYIKRLSKRMKHLRYLENKKNEGLEAIAALKKDLEKFEIGKDIEWKDRENSWQYAQTLLCLHDLCIGYYPEEINKLKDKYKSIIKELETALLHLERSGNEREYADTVLLLSMIYYKSENKNIEKIIEYYKKSKEKLGTKYLDKIAHNAIDSKLGLHQKELSLHKSLQSAERGVHVDPFNLRAWNSLGVILDEMKYFDDAKRSFEHGYSLFPDNAVVCYNLGVIYFNHAQDSRHYLKMEELLKDSIEFFNRSTDLFESNRPDLKYQCHYFIGYANLQLKNYENAIANFFIAKNLMNIDNLKYENLIIHLRLAETFLKSRAYDKCEEMCFDILKNFKKIKYSPNKKIITSLDIEISLVELKAWTRIILALSYLERESWPDEALKIASSVEKSILLNKTSSKDEKLTREERKEYFSICRDIKGYAFCKKGHYQEAISELKLSIRVKARPSSYLHLALTNECMLKIAKDQAYEQDLIDDIRGYCRRADELDVLREYSEPRKELLQRLEAKSNSRVKGDNSKMDISVAIK